MLGTAVRCVCGGVIACQETDLLRPSEAYNEASFALIRLLQAFDGFSLADDVQPANSRAPDGGVLLQTQITLYMKGGLWLRVQESKAA